MRKVEESAINITPEGIIVSEATAVDPNQHTEEIQEIITKVPSWITRWGISLFFCILLISAAISVLVRYPDMVKAPMSFQSSGSSVIVVANTPGKITKVFVKKDQQVNNGQLLLEIQNTTDKKLYLLRAPENGTVGFSAIIQPGIATVLNQEMLRIHPHNEQLFGVAKIAQNNISKVKEGQDVLINLSNYSSEKYSLLKGKVNYVANEPGKDGLFIAKITFNNVGTSDKNIRIGHWMTCEAQIIIEDASLQSRIYRSIVKGLK